MLSSSSVIIIDSLQSTCALILSTNGNMATSCAWVTKNYVYAWLCSWPYPHDVYAGTMLCKRKFLGNFSQGFADVEIYLFRLRLCFHLILHYLREVWLQSPFIHPSCVQLSSTIHELVAPIVKLLYDFEGSFPVWHKLITLIVVKSVVVATAPMNLS